MIIFIFLLIFCNLAFADTFEKISDNQVKRISEKVEDVDALKLKCDNAKENLNRFINEYQSQIDKCEHDLASIAQDTGIDTNSEEFR